VIDEALRRLSPKSAMAKELAYGRKSWSALTRFLDEGHAEIDTDVVEQPLCASMPQVVQAA
jgi:transposase